MRILVITKTRRYYVCSTLLNDSGEYEEFELVMGGRVRIPKDNIDTVETYTDTVIERYRYRLHWLEQDDRFMSGTNDE